MFLFPLFSPFHIPKKNKISTLFSLLSPSISSIKEKTAKRKREHLHFFLSFLLFYKRKRRELGTKSIPFSSLSSSFFFFQNSNGEMGISSSPSSLFPKIKKGIRMKRRRENLHFFLSFLFQISRKKRNRISSFFFSSYLLAER